MKWVHLAWLLTAFLPGCGSVHGGPVAFRTQVGTGVPADCSSDRATSVPACEHATPEVSSRPRYTLHFAEFDDEGWLFPGPGDDGYRPEMGRAHDQIDNAISDLQAKLAKGSVLLLVYVHGWKHSSWYQDSDVQRFREILADAAIVDRPSLAALAPSRQVVGIYVGWRGNTFPASEPFSNLTFWARKDAALRVASGSVRELFARIRALRNDWHPEHKGLDVDGEPFLRSIVIGHSFGAQIAFASLEPSILLDLAAPTADVAQWRSNRLKQTTDLTILLNPAFEGSAYEPVDRLARAFKLPSAYEPPVLVTVTSTADRATGFFFPLGRSLSTLTERPFVSNDQAEAVVRTPGFVDRYRTHLLRPETDRRRNVAGAGSTSRKTRRSTSAASAAFTTSSRKSVVMASGLKPRAPGPRCRLSGPGNSAGTQRFSGCPALTPTSSGTCRPPRNSCLDTTRSWATPSSRFYGSFTSM